MTLGMIACGETGTTVIAHLDADATLDGITRLHLTARNGAAPREYDLVPPNATIPPAIDIAIHVPPSARGTFEVAVDAFAGEAQIGHAENMLELVPGKATTLLLQFGSGPQPDLAGADLAGDLRATVVDLVGQDLLGADLVELPDLAIVGLPLTVTPNDHEFSPLAEGEASAAFALTLQNPNSANVTDLTIAIVGADAAQFSQTNNCGLLVGALLTCTINVTFHPSGGGARSATLLVNGTIGAEPASGNATLSGFALGNNGIVCDDIAQCQSGHCVDGRCCDADALACTGCSACNVVGFEGTCTPVPDGVDPHGACASVFCSTQTCDGSGACKAGNSGAICQVDSCSGTTETIHTCSGNALLCPSTTTTRTCPDALTCGASACRTSCAADGECVGTYCDMSGQCHAKLPSGATCDRPAQCTSNICLGTTCVDCTKDSHCAGNTWCDNNVCKPKLAALATCSRAAQCTNNVCEDGKCRNCSLINRYCGGNTTSVCVTTGDGANKCDWCGGVGGASTCSAAGIGAYCGGDGCLCDSSTQCSAINPVCLIRPGYSSGFCWCGAPGSYTQCFYGSRCDGSVCKTMSGYGCSVGANCESGVCTNEVCM